MTLGNNRKQHCVHIEHKKGYVHTQKGSRTTAYYLSAIDSHHRKHHQQLALQSLYRDVCDGENQQHSVVAC